MRNSLVAIGVLASVLSTAAMGQSAVEYTRKFSGSIEVTAAGEVSTYTLQSAGVPAIDQSLGSLVESWRFRPVAAAGTARSVKAEFVINLVRANLADTAYVLRRVEFYPTDARPPAHRAATPEELAYCANPDRAPRRDVLCPAVVPDDETLGAQGVGAEAYIAIRRSESGPQVALDSLSLFTGQNVKVSNKAFAAAKQKYGDAALRYGRDNAAAFLQDRDMVIARVELVRANNKTPWRRQDKVDLPKVDWLSDELRRKTVYVSQGVLELN